MNRSLQDLLSLCWLRFLALLTFAQAGAVAGRPPRHRRMTFGIHHPVM